MELLTIILLVIIVLLTYLLLKKEKVLGIKTETKDNNEPVSYTHLTLPTICSV